MNDRLITDFVLNDFPEDRDADTWDCNCPACRRYITIEGMFNSDLEVQDYQEWQQEMADDRMIFQMSRHVSRQKNAGLKRINRRDNRWFCQWRKHRGRKSGSGNGRCKSQCGTTLSMELEYTRFLANSAVTN